MICYHARWVVPVTSPPVAEGTVACEDGLIRYVGPRRGAPAGEAYELGDALLLPGLVNAHTHLELTAMRGFLDGLPFPAWISTLTRARNEVFDDAMLLDSARLGVAEGLEHGVTTYADTSASGTPLRAMRELGVRGIVYQEVFGPDPTVCDGAVADLRCRVGRLRTEAAPAGHRLAVGVSPHAPYTVSDDLYRATVQYAREERLPMAMHIAESEEEEALVTRGEGEFADRLRRRGIGVAGRARSPVELLDCLGCLHERALLIHAVRVNRADVRTIVLRGARIAHCPASNARFGHGIAPVSDFLHAGIHVGLGSDSVASNNRMDILEEARLAALFQGALLKSPSAVPAQTALELATIRGAYTLDLGGVTGSLEVGKAADLSAFPLGGFRTTPAEDPVSTAVHALSGTRATFVAVAGERLVEDGRVLGDSGALYGCGTKIGRALAAWKRGV